MNEFEFLVIDETSLVEHIIAASAEEAYNEFSFNHPDSSYIEVFIKCDF